MNQAIIFMKRKGTTMIKLLGCIVLAFLSKSPSCDTVFKYISLQDTTCIYEEDITKIDSIGACQFHFHLSEISRLNMQSKEKGTVELLYNTGIGGWVTVTPLNFHAQEIPLGYSVILTESESYTDNEGCIIDEDGCIRMNIRIIPWKAK